ncbi:MAG: hypothetical protein FD170_3243 [Bacteroidetes bacterium]|nr:MAG: hypothetical protein FD170_3243 [Bacteroidota bacterium]
MVTETRIYVEREREREREREVEHRSYCKKASRNDVRNIHLDYYVSTGYRFLSRSCKLLQAFNNSSTTRFGYLLPYLWLPQCRVVPP